MKTLIQKPTSILWVVLVGLLAFTPFDSKAQQAEVSFQIFYDELAPHGRWLLHPKYGDVWAPNVQGEFTPYLTNGYWTVTQYGNTWVSNYDWGWATFHYGRWYFDEFEGWVWIPDTEWAPAWVVWRNGGGYYGWAAMSPGINFNVSLTLFDGIPGNYWCFVPQQYVWRPYLYRYCAPRHRNVYIVSNTTYVSHCRVNNITYNYYTGPSHTEITYVTNRPVVIHHVENTNKPGRSQVSRDKIAMYTPIVKRNEINRPALGSLGSNNGWGKGPVRGGNDNGSGNDQGNNGSNGGQGNNGHGNGDQDAPGNSGGNNNGENSENGGEGNSGKGKGGNNSSRWSSSNSSNRTHDSNDNFENWKRSENNNVRSYRSTEINKSSNTSAGSNNRSGWSNSGGNNRSFSSGNSGNSGGNTKSYTPSRSNSSSSGNRTYTPSSSGNSGSSGKSYTPSRSSGNSGGSNRSITPSRSSGSSSGGSKTVTPSRSSGSNSNGSPKSKSKN
jgi:hypothetical protein